MHYLFIYFSFWKQLSENDDEISRIESNYRESMRRLAEDRERILSTLRERSDPAGSDPGTTLTPPYQPCASCSTQTGADAEPETPTPTRFGSGSSQLGSGPPRASSGSGSGSGSEPSPTMTSSHLTGAGATTADSPGGDLSGRSAATLEDVGPFHTLPTASGSSERDGIEVLTGSGESETISYRELALRLANRDDVMVVGNHRRASTQPPPPPAPSAAPSSISGWIDSSEGGGGGGGGVGGCVSAFT